MNIDNIRKIDLINALEDIEYSAEILATVVDTIQEKIDFSEAPTVNALDRHSIGDNAPQANNNTYDYIANYSTVFALLNATHDYVWKVLGATRGVLNSRNAA